MNQNEEMFLESNVVSIFALSLKKLGGAQFWFLFSKIWKHVYSSTLGHQNITFFFVEKSGTESWILSTRFEENMFDLHFLAQLKISGAETWLLRQNLKETYIIFNFGPHPGKSNKGVKFGYFHQFEQDIVYLQLWAPLKIKIFAGVQAGILCVKVWKETNLSSALGPTKNCSSWWGPNW